VSDTGKEILREHLLLVADSLSVTGEFVALNAKGWSKQRQVESTPAPFTQACFSVCNKIPFLLVIQSLYRISFDT